MAPFKGSKPFGEAPGTLARTRAAVKRHVHPKAPYKMNRMSYRKTSAASDIPRGIGNRVERSLEMRRARPFGLTKEKWSTLVKSQEMSADAPLMGGPPQSARTVVTTVFALCAIFLAGKPTASQFCQARFRGTGAADSSLRAAWGLRYCFQSSADLPAAVSLQDSPLWISPTKDTMPPHCRRLTRRLRAGPCSTTL